MLPATIWNQPVELWAAWVTIVSLPLLVGSLIYALRIARSQNTIALNTMVFNDPTNVLIMGAIEANEPILKEHKGAFLSVQLDKYLGDFETVAAIYHKGLFTKQQLDEHFSDYIERLGGNKEVAEYLEKYPGFYGGLRDLIKEYPPKPLQTDSTSDPATRVGGVEKNI